LREAGLDYLNQILTTEQTSAGETHATIKSMSISRIFICSGLSGFPWLSMGWSGPDASQVVLCN